MAAPKKQKQTEIKIENQITADVGGIADSAIDIRTEQADQADSGGDNNRRR